MKLYYHIYILFKRVSISPKLGDSMEIRTSDLYEAAYYLTAGVIPHQITCRTLEGNTTREFICDFYFNGEMIPKLQGNFLRSEAAVNLALFRRCYGEINNYANNAKRDYRRNQKVIGGQI